jgi:6-phosphogluconolactonase
MRSTVCILGLIAIGVAAAPASYARSEHVLYIGTYTDKTASKGIYAFRFNDSTGALTSIGLVAETPNPSFLTASANGRFVYAVNELENFGGAPGGSVTAFAVDAGTSKLTQLNVQATGGAKPCHLVLDKTGRFLAVANYSGGNYSLFPVDADGRLQAAASVLTGQPVEGNPAKALGHMVGFDAGNKYLVTADKGLNQMLVFTFDARSGKAALNNTPPVTLPTGSGPRHYAFHPSGKWLFTINEQGATITTFAWNAKTGSLTAKSSVPTRPAEAKSGSTAEIAVHKSGRFVYGSNRGHNSIAVFGVGDDGALTLVEYEPTRGQTPRNFALDPSGRWLIAGNERTDTLAVFSIDQKTGALTPAGELTSVPSPVSILFMN